VNCYGDEGVYDSSHRILSNYLYIFENAYARSIKHLPKSYYSELLFPFDKKHFVITCFISECALQASAHPTNFLRRVNSLLL
jgi:hypothetical protein